MKTELEELYSIIKGSINSGGTDLSALKDQTYRRESFIRTVNDNWGLFNEDAPRCFVYRQQALLNLYADFCNPSCFPFVKGKNRKELFIKVINNHFDDML